VSKTELWQVVERNGKRGLSYHFHPGQLRAWDSTRRFVFMLAGTQGGKTSFSPLWMHREIQRCGPGDYLAVTATFPLLRLKMLPEFRRFFEQTLHIAVWKGSDFALHLNDGSRIIFGSATHPESLESATAKAAVMDECGQDQFRLGSWEAVQRRLSLNQGRVLGGTTIYNLGWLKQQAYDRWLAGDPDYDVIQFESIINPAFPRAEYERARRSLPGWKFRMFYEGQFDRPPGLIYADFINRYREEDGHKVRPFNIPPEWPRFVGIDFGAVHTALVWLAWDPTVNVYYLYRESLEGNKTTAEHARGALIEASGKNVISWHGGSRSELQQRMDWAAAGVIVQEPPFDDVEVGINRVTELLKTRRLFIFDTCAGVLDELGTYSRTVGEDGQPTEKIKDKAEFHHLDALRYVVIGITTPAVRTDEIYVYDERVHISDF